MPHIAGDSGTRAKSIERNIDSRMCRQIKYLRPKYRGAFAILP